MLLKAAILHRGGKIRKPREKQTIGFDACVRRALRDDEGGFINEEQALTLQVINSLRDAAQHHLLDISENHLYIHAQSGLTLFRDICRSVFGYDISKELPERVLPISTSPPLDLNMLFDQEIEEVRKLLTPGSRRKIEASAKLRSLAILEGAIQGERLQPGRGELRKLMKHIKEGAKWEQLFPGVASIGLSVEGSGPTLSLRISKKEGIPIKLVPEGTPGAGVVAVKRVNELDFYNLGHNQLAEKVGLTTRKLSAVIWYAEIRGNPKYHKQIKVRSAKYECYSQEAIKKVKEILEENSIEDIWKKYREYLLQRRQ